MSELTHFNEQGRARMVDVTEKAVTHRTAVAAGEVHMAQSTLEKIRDNPAQSTMKDAAARLNTAYFLLSVSMCSLFALLLFALLLEHVYDPHCMQRARIVVGARMATCLPSITALNAARRATSVLP